MVVSEQLRGRPAAAIGPTLRDIVVVVPVHNERDRRPACLATVAAAADQVTVPVMIVVVLDACSDRSEEAIARPVRAMNVSGRNVGAARAAGFAAAAPRSDARTWLATTDADSVVPTTWLADQAVHHRALVQGVVGTVSVDWTGRADGGAGGQRAGERRARAASLLLPGRPRLAGWRRLRTSIPCR